MACLAGFAEQRARGQEYLKWLLRHRENAKIKIDHVGRNDVSLLCLFYFTYRNIARDNVILRYDFHVFFFFQ